MCVSTCIWGRGMGLREENGISRGLQQFRIGKLELLLQAAIDAPCSPTLFHRGLCWSAVNYWAAGWEKKLDAVKKASSWLTILPILSSVFSESEFGSEKRTVSHRFHLNLKWPCFTACAIHSSMELHFNFLKPQDVSLISNRVWTVIFNTDKKM